MTTEQTRTLVQAYYACWQEGAQAYDDARLHNLISPSLEFSSPNTPRGNADTFFSGLARFAKSVKSLQRLQLTASDDEAAALYDCHTIEGAPVPTFRCAEFFRVSGGRISSITLVFDPGAMRKPQP